jgi:hypothetical protein
MFRTLPMQAMCAAWLMLGVTVGIVQAEDTPQSPPGIAKPAVPAPTPAVTSKDVVSESVPCEVDRGHGPVRKFLHAMHPGGEHRSKPPLGPDEVRVGCYSHYNDFTCGSLRSDCRFIFGSCRQFFGERCIKGPPPFPVEGFDRNWLYPGGVPPEPKKFGKHFGRHSGSGCGDCQ